MRISVRQVENLIAYQVGALAAIAASEGLPLQHVKPHGALFNMAVRDATLADAVARAIALVDRSLILFGLPQSQLVAAGVRAGLRTAAEGFADRAYQPDGTLMPRGQPGSVIEDPQQVEARALMFACEGAISAADGSRLELAVDTVCVHGDTPGAGKLAARIRSALTDAGVDVKAVGAE